MRKTYLGKKYKNWHKSSSIKNSRNELKRKKKKYNPFKSKYDPEKTSYNKKTIKPPILSPEFLSLLNNTEKTIIFFQKIRNNQHISIEDKKNYIQLDLSQVRDIDFSTICVLKAIIEELSINNIITRGNFPKNKIARGFIEESGLLNYMRDYAGKEFTASEKSELIFIQKGKKKLKKEDNIRISTSIKKAVKHLTGKDNHCPSLRNILLEICGNSIEWGGTKGRGWLLGLKYNEGEVIFTVTDVGKGILNTLNRKFKIKIQEILSNSTDLEILKNAFTKKYGSSSLEENRNKGLPSIKKGFDDGLLLNLKVATNNVILDFDDENKSIYLNRRLDFMGTLYRWSINPESLNNRTNGKENN